MSKNAEKLDIQLEPTAGQMVLSFLYACLFGVVSVLPWLELKDAIPILIRALGGYKYAFRAQTIILTLVLGVAWLVLFLVLWNRIEHNFSYKRGLLISLKWSAVAAVVYAAAIGLHVLGDFLLARAI